jgi:hypothetical protein
MSQPGASYADVGDADVVAEVVLELVVGELTGRPAFLDKHGVRSSEQLRPRELPVTA